MCFPLSVTRNDRYYYYYKIRSSNKLTSLKSSLKCHLFKLSYWLSLYLWGVAERVGWCVFAELCFDCVLGYVLQFGEKAHKRVHYCYYYIVIIVTIFIIILLLLFIIRLQGICVN